MENKKIYIASDHTGNAMRKAIFNHLRDQGYHVIDLSRDEINAKGSVSYSNHGLKLGETVVADKGSRGIAICGTGIGISIAANKVKGVRCGLTYELETAALIRSHNNANIMATGARLIAIEKAVLLVDAFLNQEFEGGRHAERVHTLDTYDK